MKQLLFVALLLCVSFQVACSQGGQPTAQASRETGRLSDSDLKKQIEAKINSDDQLRAANLSVSADSDHNTATLSGTVASESLRTKAINLANTAQPGLVVNDKIDVKPAEKTSDNSRTGYTSEQARREKEKAHANKESIGDSLDDASIHSKIVAKLLTDKNTPERKINVDVNNNVVTLRGTVDTILQKEEAGRVAKETDGVKGVINQLKVSRS